MKTESNSSTPAASDTSVRWHGWLLPTGFLILTAAILMMPRLAAVPVAESAVINPAELKVGPMRTAMTDPPHVLVEGVPENCNACHQIFESSHAAGAALQYHQDVLLNHGLNDRCVNCHDVKDRERLTLRDGVTVPFSQTPQLCSQCHGTVFRDWQRGMHGKTLGSWITGSAEQRRLSCNECHNPHAPRYEAMAPLPAPDTLRMGDQGPHHEHAPREERSPLQKWLHALPPKAVPGHGQKSSTGTGEHP